MDKKTLSEYIRRNELDAFFKAAAQITKVGEAWQNELILLERRFVELEDQEGDGVLSPEEAARLRNGISRDGMNLLEELNAPQPLHPAFPNVQKSKKSTLWISLGAGVLVALLIWQFGLSKDKNRQPQPDQEVSIVKPTEDSRQTNSESGVALKVSGNNDKFDAEIAAFLEKVLLEKGIATHAAEKGGSYASAIDCRFSVDKTRTRTGDGKDASKLTIILTLTARNSDNVVCYTKRYSSDVQMMRPEEEEKEAIKKGIKSLREAIKSSGIRACAD